MLDVATEGSGLELFDTTPEAAGQGRIIASVELRGAVRDAVPPPNELVRVGMGCTDLTGAAASYVESLHELGARWRTRPAPRLRSYGTPRHAPPANASNDNPGMMG